MSPAAGTFSTTLPFLYTSSTVARVPFAFSRSPLMLFTPHVEGERDVYAATVAATNASAYSVTLHRVDRVSGSAPVAFPWLAWEPALPRSALSPPPPGTGSLLSDDSPPPPPICQCTPP